MPTTSIAGKTQPPPGCEGRSLTDFYETPIDETKTLLGNRFLCCGGACLFVGPSGVGKSSASVQQDVQWALGKEAFGIKPARPLKILTFQAENDDGDMTEISRGVIDGLQLTAEDRESLRGNAIYITSRGQTGSNFIRGVLQPSLAFYKPDIIRLDVLNAYSGCDPSDAEKITFFLRSNLAPLLHKFNCGAIINHHTPKTTNRDTSLWRPADWAYACAGNNDITNFVRAIIVIDPTTDPKVFRFIGAKRGPRIGWCDARGEIETNRFFSHGAGKIYWVDSTKDAIVLATCVKSRSTRDPSESEFISLLPTTWPPDNPRQGLHSNAELQKLFKKHHYDKNSLAAIRDQLESQRKIGVVRGLPRNQVLVGTCKAAVAFNEHWAAQKQKG